MLRVRRAIFGHSNAVNWVGGLILTMLSTNIFKQIEGKEFVFLTYFSENFLKWMDFAKKDGQIHTIK